MPLPLRAALLRQPTPQPTSFIGRQAEFAAMLPPLWQIKVGLEAACGASFGDWRQEEAAADEVAGFLAGRRQGGAKSA